MVVIRFRPKLLYLTYNVINNQGQVPQIYTIQDGPNKEMFIPKQANFNLLSIFIVYTHYRCMRLIESICQHNIN